MNNRRLARGAMLIALALALQAVRLVLPLPQPVSTFVIGSLVHMMLVLTWRLSGLVTALLLALLLPLTAYLQGQVLLPLLIPVIWAGNVLFVVLLQLFSANHRLALFLPPLAKAVLMGVAAWCVVNIVALPNLALRKTIMFGMSVPQLVTAFIGIWLARQVFLRIRKL